MSVVWHIVRKDLRRFALPAIAWLALLVIPTVVFRLKSVAIDGHVASSIDTAMTLFAIWGRLLGAVHGLLGYAIASSLMLEDPLVGTNAFWATRPISGARLLGAKLIGVAIVFGLLPLVALSPIWIASGFSAAEVLDAAGEFLRFNAGIVLLAVAIASLSRNLAQVLFCTVAVIGAYVGILLLATQIFSIRFRHSTELLTGTLPIVLGVVVVLRFLTRRLVPGWISLVGAMFVVMVVQVDRPTFSRPDDRGVPPPAGTAEDRAAKVDVVLGNFSPNPNSVPSLVVSAPWAADGKYVPMYARLPSGRTGRGPNGQGVVESGLRELGFSSASGPLRWQVMIPWLLDRPDSELRLNGSLEIWSVKTEVVGELPIAVGNTARSGATSTRIVELIREGERLDAIFVEERDSRTRSRAEMFEHFDRYYLVDRKRNIAVGVSGGQPVGSSEMHSLALSFRRLHVAGGSDWKDGALIRLRFQRERRFSRPFATEGMNLFTP